MGARSSMKLRSAALAMVAVCSAVGVAFEVPAAAMPAGHAAMCARTPTLSMVAAKDVFGQYYEASPPMQKSMQTLPPPVAKTAMAGLVAASGAAGFLLTPSRRIAVNAVGGLLTASAGNAARKRLASVRQQAATAAVAAILSEGLPKVTSETLGSVASEYDVPKKEFQAQLSALYLTFLNACLTSHNVETSELSELLRLQQLLRLSSMQVGAQVYAAARQLYSRHRAYLEDTEQNDSKKLLAKFVFLAERVLSGDDSPEGYKYEVMRLQKIFSLTQNEWRAMAEDAAVPFYEKALNSAVMEAKPVTAQQLEAVRASLGITDTCAESMHADIFSRSAAELLSANGRFADADKERLATTQALLGMSAAAAATCLRTLTAPLYKATFDEVVAELNADESDVDERSSALLSGKLALRQQELLLETAEVGSIEVDALREAATTKLEAANSFMRAQNVPEGVKGVKALLGFCSKLATFMVAINRASGDATNALSTLFSGINGSLKQSEILSQYRVLLLHFLEDLKVDPDQAAGLSSLRTILGMTEAEAASIYQAAAGPLYQTALQKAVADDTLGPEQKADVQTAANNLALPAAVTLKIAVEVYSDQLRNFAGEGKIIDEDQAAKLAALRDFLSLEMASVQKVHEELCAPSYRDSVREVMGTAGIIPEEYWDGLSTLRQRLGISEETARDLFALEVTAKMKEFGTKAVEAMEKKLNPQESAKQDDDSKGTMNIESSSLTTELLNLVDFAVASKAIVTEEVDGKMVDGIGADLRGEISDRALKELYRQYLVEAFSGGEASQNAKLFESLGKLSLVLGLTDGEVTAIHNEIGTRIYRQYTSKALKKGPLGKEEVTFLGSIRDALGMEQALCDEVVRDQQLNRVSALVEIMFEKDQVLVEDVRTMRDTADLYDVDLKEDLAVSSVKLERFFNVELEDMLTSGTLKADDLSVLEELCESLQVTEDRASQLLTELVQKRTSGGVLQAAASMRGGSHDAAVNELLEVLKFATVLDDVKAECSVSASERSELFMLFQASRLTTGAAEDERQSKLEALKSVLGLAEAAAA